jgi:hypothetical protein
MSQPAPAGPGRWVPPVTRPRLRAAVRAEEAAAISELGLATLRRLKTGDPAAPGWPVIARLLRPLDAVNAGLDSPPTPHRRRAMLDVVALLLTRCAQPDAGSYWDWTGERWEAMLGRTVAEFRAGAPPWVGDEVRPYLAAHAFLLGGFTAFHRLGSFQRLVLCWRVFGRDRVDGELGQLRRVLGGWGYQFGRADDPLLPLTVAQLMLANGSPHLQDMTTGLFDRVREQRLLDGARLNTVHAVQRALADRRTGESVDLLFAARARRVSTAYINNTIIPMLCRKGGVPAADVRGAITSHRARSTIASQLYNAKEPMTLFELQAWLGHRSPQSTQYYAKITPTTLTRAYQDAGYFARNVRTIEVLVDRDAVASGATTNGEPWQHYDLGHGYCSYTFFEQCQHRMACARCDFYTPKVSTSAQLLEAKNGLQRMLVGVPLTDDERAAADNDQAAVDRLIQRLADIATPAGPTPKQLRAGPGRPLPLTVLPPTPAPNESAVPSIDEL